MKFVVEDPDDGEMLEIDEFISNAVIKQYIERKYTSALMIAVFIIGFLCGVIASL